MSVLKHRKWSAYYMLDGKKNKKETLVSYLPRIIRFWGLSDLAVVSLYLWGSFINGRIPFHYEINNSFNIVASFENPAPFLVVGAGMALYVSIAISGVLLFQMKKAGAILSYVQTPLRLALATPSLFFIFGPFSILKAIPGPPIFLAGALVVLSETLKLSTVILWHRNLNKAV